MLPEEQITAAGLDKYITSKETDIAGFTEINLRINEKRINIRYHSPNDNKVLVEDDALKQIGNELIYVGKGYNEKFPTLDELLKKIKEDFNL